MEHNNFWTYHNLQDFPWNGRQFLLISWCSLHEHLAKHSMFLGTSLVSLILLAPLSLVGFYMRERFRLITWSLGFVISQMSNVHFVNSIPLFSQGFLCGHQNCNGPLTQGNISLTLSSCLRTFLILGCIHRSPFPSIPKIRIAGQWIGCWKINIHFVIFRVNILGTYCRVSSGVSTGLNWS